MWHAILIERIILDAKMLLEYLHKKQVMKSIKNVRKFLLDVKTTSTLDPHLPNCEQFEKGDDFEKKKTIFKIFNLYIPLCKILVAGQTKSQYMSLKLFEKIQQMIFSEKVL